MLEYNGKEYKDEDLNDRQKYLLSKVAAIETQLGQLMLEKDRLRLPKLPMMVLS